MKRYLYFFFVAILASLSFTLTSCGDDKEEDLNNSNDLVGSWKLVQGSSSYLVDADYVRFEDNGTFYQIYLEDMDVQRGTWKRTGNTIELKSSEFLATTVEILELTNSTLKIKLLSIPYTYKKVSNTETDKYIK